MVFSPFVCASVCAAFTISVDALTNFLRTSVKMPYDILKSECKHELQGHHLEGTGGGFMDPQGFMILILIFSCKLYL